MIDAISTMLADNTSPEAKAIAARIIGLQTIPKSSLHPDQHVAYADLMAKFLLTGKLPRDMPVKTSEDA